MTVKLASSVASRLRGLLGRGDYPHTLLLAPCNDVHTFGMGRPIDIAFVDSGGLVLEAHREVGAFRRVRCKGAAATFERIATPSPWYRRGDRIDLKNLDYEVL